MKRTCWIAVVCLGLALAGAPVSGQDQKPAPPKAAVSSTQTLLDAWNDIGRKLIAMAEDCPEDKYDFKPTPAQRTFAQQLLHVANANYYFTNPAMGLKPPAGDDPKRDDYRTRAAVVAFVK